MSTVCTYSAGLGCHVIKVLYPQVKVGTKMPFCCINLKLPLSGSEIRKQIKGLPYRSSTLTNYNRAKLQHFVVQLLCVKSLVFSSVVQQCDLLGFPFAWVAEFKLRKLSRRQQRAEPPPQTSCVFMGVFP